MASGRSIIALPDSFVVVDTETTGLDFDFDNIIEVSAIRYENGICVDTYTSLVKPPMIRIYDEASDTDVEAYVTDFITDLTGITNEMLASAPSIDSVLPGFMDFLGDSTIIGHNIPFDVKFLNSACSDLGMKPLSNDYVNTVRIVRKVFPGNPHYRLSDMANYCGIKQDSAHRALADCETTAACYLLMRERILADMTEQDFQKTFEKHTHGESYAKFIEGLESLVDTANEDSPIYGKTIVFTGTLERMQRKDALTLVAQRGGIPSDKLNKETNYLVVGNGEFVASVKNGKTAKMKKAEAMAVKGIDIHVISENTFFKMIEAF